MRRHAIVAVLGFSAISMTAFGTWAQCQSRTNGEEPLEANLVGLICPQYPLMQNADGTTMYYGQRWQYTLGQGCHEGPYAAVISGLYAFPTICPDGCETVSSKDRMHCDHSTQSFAGYPGPTVDHRFHPLEDDSEHRRFLRVCHTEFWAETCRRNSALRHDYVSFDNGNGETIYAKVMDIILPIHMLRAGDPDDVVMRIGYETTHDESIDYKPVGAEPFNAGATAATIYNVKYPVGIPLPDPPQDYVQYLIFRSEEQMKRESSNRNE